MECYAARLTSFAKGIRVKNPGLTATTNIKWSHPSSFKATPETLAEAGFYFSPGWEDRDTVTCFICGKQLSDWADDDDPFELHWTKCKASCVWAQVRCGLMDDIDEEGNYTFTNKTRSPGSKSMEKARAGTFTTNNWWPYDSVKNHGANSKRMAQAGFVYTPQTPGDDTASCLYCNISLSGWEPEDKPMEEHKKREKKAGVPCPFLSPISAGDALPASKSSSSSTNVKPKAKPKANLKASRSKKVVESSEEEIGVDDELELLPQPPVKKSRSTSGSKKPPSVDAESKTRRTTRVASRTGSVMSDVGTEDEAGTGKKAGKGKGKSKKNSSKKEEVIQEEVDLEDEPLEAEKPKRGRPKSRKTVAAGEDEDAMKVDPPPAKPPSKPPSKAKPPSKSKPTSKSRSRAPAESEMDSDVPAPVAKPKPRSKSKAARSKSRPESESDAPAKPKPARTKSKAAVGKAEKALDQLDEEAGGSQREEGDAMEVVDIMTDEEGELQAADLEPTRQVQAISKPTKKGKKKTPSSENVPEVFQPKQGQEPELDEPMEDEPLPTEMLPPPSTPPPPRSPSPAQIVHVNHFANGDSHSPSSPGSPSDIPTFLPPLALAPIPHIVSLSDSEQDMTVEQWIRHEISVQYEQLKGDGEKRIDAFRERAEEVRKRINAL